MAETIDLCFQWKQGENRGLVDKVATEKTIGEDNFYVFESGRIINKNVVEEYLVQIPSLDQPLFVDDTVVQENRAVSPPVPVKKQNAQRKPSIKRKDVDYPSEEELSRNMHDGKYSMGNADVIPHPDEIPQMQQQMYNVQQDNFASGIAGEYDDTNEMTRGLSYEEPTVRIEKANPVTAIIDKAKKKEFELELKLKVNLPAQGLFDILDDEFVAENLESILNVLINKIKQTDLDEQLKANLISIYNINAK
jgi:hypothetical protein